MSEYENEQPTRFSLLALIFNVLTIGFLVATLCIVIYFAVVFMSPRSGVNFFPPPELPTRVPTLTPSPPAGQQLEPTWTPRPPTATPAATETSIPAPTRTPRPTQAALPVASPTEESVVATAPPGGMPYTLQGGAPIYIQNIAYPDLGCNWMGVAGQVFDLSSRPVVGLTVELGGFLDGESVDLLSLTGVARQYGEGGYQFELASAPIASSGSLFIQLLEQGGIPLSDQYYFDTFEECDKNLVLINFVQVGQP